MTRIVLFLFVLDVIRTYLIPLPFTYKLYVFDMCPSYYSFLFVFSLLQNKKPQIGEPFVLKKMTKRKKKPTIYKNFSFSVCNPRSCDVYDVCNAT